MTAFQMVVPRVWNMNVPTVCRYVETQFLNDFFETGGLRLSTFPHYTAIEDATRRDEREGQANFHFTRDGFNISGWQDVGKRSYMMCTSLSESPDLMELFNCDNYIKINNVLAFADAISRYIPGFIGGHVGPCIYRSRREINRATTLSFGMDTMARVFKGDMADEKRMTAATEQSRTEMSVDLQAEIQFEHYFLKEDIFAPQSEFRIVWNVPYDAEEFLHIKCPEAIDFCSPGIETERTSNHRYKAPPHSNGVVVIAGTHSNAAPPSTPDVDAEKPQID